MGCTSQVLQVHGVYGRTAGQGKGVRGAALLAPLVVLIGLVVAPVVPQVFSLSHNQWVQNKRRILM